MSGSTESAGYIHGTTPSEQDRLATLNRLTNQAFVEFLEVRPQARVLEVGSGLGHLAGEVADAAEGVRVVGVEKSREQLESAREHAHVEFVEGDALDLDFEDAIFDLVYARYLLEHVSDPVRALSEMRRVVRPGGRVAVCENDISLSRVDPPCPAADEAWDRFQDLQERLGGDARIGRRLYRLFREASFENVELSVQPEIHWHGSPDFAAWIENLIGNIDGARQGLIDHALCAGERIDEAVREMRSLLDDESASAVFVWNRALAIR